MTTQAAPKHIPDHPYDKRKLSYASTFPNPVKRNIIRTMEWMTGKLPLLQMVRRFEARGPAHGQAFWPQALEMMGVELQTPQAEIEKIPAKGPLIVVANHPHGLVDGMIFAELIGRIRQDYKILTRSLLTGVKEIEQFMIPVPFPHEKDARLSSLKMRQDSMAHLSAGGCIAIFPSGVVSSSETYFGPALEQVWNPFTAKMIERSGATVLPMCFTGQNSRAYQIANQLSATLRQGLLIHEVIRTCNRPQRPFVGDPISAEDIRAQGLKPRDLMAWLREKTLNLGNMPLDVPQEKTIIGDQREP